MKLKGILSAYQEAKEKDILTYLSNPTKGSLHKCLIDFINSNSYDNSYDSVILGYFRGLKNISSVIHSSKEDDFKAMASLLMGSTTSYNRIGLLPLLKILLEYDIRFSLETIHVVKEVHSGELSGLDVEKQLIKTYTGKSLFTHIHINGDINNQVGPLSMEDYYIQLSSISYKDIGSRETLINLEKQYPHSLARNFQDRFNNNLSQGYISKSILSNDKVIVTGNPGVGKSTYARWLCYDWAKNVKNKVGAKILIYIQLRDLDFDSKDYLLVYIKENYLKNSNKYLNSLEAINNLQLILDGFDEISFTDRIHLSNSIKLHNYIIFSRPYGLIQHNLNYDISVQIDGFNDSCIENYINNILKNQNQKNQLKSLIRKNKVLKDYASTPLMLSYMALIFTISSDAQKALSSINSTYDLQEKVFDWILNYEELKGNINKESLNSQKSKINKFAFLMLVNKEFTYQGNLRDPNIEIVEFLSAAGLGSQKRISSKTLSWRFTFNTVTFQEFLSAQYFESKKLNYEAIVYLITDSFFWNFCIMLTGMLSKYNPIDPNKFEKEKTLNRTLNFIHELYLKDTNKKFYGYAYYMLLAECNDQTITKMIKEKNLTSIISFYKETFFDEFWNTKMQESLDKVIYKLPKNLIDKYIHILTQEVDSILNKNKIQEFSHLESLIKTGIIYGESKIVDSLIKLLITGKNLISNSSKLGSQFLRKKGKENVSKSNQLSNEYWEILDPSIKSRHLMTNVFSILGNTSQKTLLKYDKTLLDISNFLGRDLFYFKETLIYIYPENTIEDFIKKYKKIRENKTKDTTNTSKYFIQVLDLSENLYALLNKNYHYDSLERTEIHNVCVFLSDYALNNEFNEQHNNQEYFISLLTQSIILSDDKKLYSTYFKIITHFDSLMFSEIPDENSFVNYVNDQLSKNITQPKKEHIQNLIKVIENTLNTQFTYHEYLENLINLFRSILNKYYIENLDNSHTSKSSDFDSILKHIASLDYQNHEKKILIDTLLFGDTLLTVNPEFKNSIAISLFNNLIFYEGKYWSLLFAILEEEEWNLSFSLLCLGNSNLFLFKSNLPNILKLFVSIFSKNKNIESVKLIPKISNTLVLVSNILLHLKSYEGEYKQETLLIIERILTNQEVKKVIKTSLKNQFDTDKNILAFLLFQIHNPVLEKFLRELNIYRNISIEPYVKISILNSLIQYTYNPNYGIEINEIEKLKSILEEQLYTDLQVLIKQRLVQKNKFDPSHLVMLLNQNAS